jgi:hypothetical protein
MNEVSENRIYPVLFMVQRQSSDSGGLGRTIEAGKIAFFCGHIEPVRNLVMKFVFSQEV